MLVYTYIYINIVPVQRGKSAGAQERFWDGAGAFSSSLTVDAPIPVDATTQDIDNIPLSTVAGFKEIAQPWYVDQVLPFDITIVASNEYGAGASCKIFGVEILNEGWGTSVDDSVMEQQGTFIARSVLLPLSENGSLQTRCYLQAATDFSRARLLPSQVRIRLCVC